MQELLFDQKLRQRVDRYLYIFKPEKIQLKIKRKMTEKFIGKS